jgi:hypothetical protein
MRQNPRPVSRFQRTAGQRGKPVRPPVKKSNAPLAIAACIGIAVAGFGGFFVAGGFDKAPAETQPKKETPKPSTSPAKASSPTQTAEPGIIEVKKTPQPPPAPNKPAPQEDLRPIRVNAEILAEEVQKTPKPEPPKMPICSLCDGKQALTGDMASKANATLEALASVDNLKKAAKALGGGAPSQQEIDKSMRVAYMMSRLKSMKRIGSIKCPNCSGSGWEPPKSKSKEFMDLMDKLESSLKK